MKEVCRTPLRPLGGGSGFPRWIYLAGLIIFFLWGCRHAPGRPHVSGASANPQANPYREQARLILEGAVCSSCHHSGRETASPKALLIYDLADSSWYSKMTPDQLNGALSRLEKGASKPDAQVTQAQLSIFRKFVEQELQRRTRE